MTRSGPAEGAHRSASRRNAIAASLLVLFVLSGVGYRAFAAWLDRAPGELPFRAGALAELPLELGPWEGRDRPLAEALIRAADVDDYLYRQYTRPRDRSEVALWVAFGVRARDLAPHRPGVCYPAAGWGLRKHDAVTLENVAAEALVVQYYDFESPHLDGRPVTVLNYYVVDGRALSDIGELRAVAWRGGVNLQYVAQVQVTARSGTGPAEAEQRRADLADFTREFHPALLRTLASALRPASSDEPEAPQ